MSLIPSDATEINRPINPLPNENWDSFLNPNIENVMDRRSKMLVNVLTAVIVNAQASFSS